MTKTVIFDFGGVLTESGTENKWDKMTAELSDKFGVNIFPKDGPSPLYEEFCTGKVTPESYFQNLIDLAKSKVNTKDFIEGYAAVYDKWTAYDKRMLDLVDGLRKNYAVVCHSDNNDVHWKVNSRRGLTDHFDNCFTSFELGVLKSDPAAFSIVTQKLSTAPKDCIFIDDRKINIENSKSIGMKGILFHNYKQLVQELRSRRII